MCFIVSFCGISHPKKAYLYKDLTFMAIVLPFLTLKVLVATIDAQWEGMGDVG